MTVIWVMMVNVHIVQIITVIWVRIVQMLLETEMKMMVIQRPMTKRGKLKERRVRGWDDVEIVMWGMVMVTTLQWRNITCEPHLTSIQKT